MSTTVRETERKYDAEQQTQLPRLGDLPGVSATVGPDEHTLEAVYYDTEDLRLARSGVTLRRRRGGDDAGWHLKLPADRADSRDEVQLPDTGDSQPPAELVELTRAHTMGRELQPVALLTTRRRRWLLLDDYQQPAAEVVDDAVTGHTVGAETSAQSWREFEVELKGHGSSQLLDAVERRLRDAGIRRSKSGSKLARLLADRLGEAGAPPPAQAAGTPTAGDAVADYLRTWVDELKRRDPQVRKDAPEAVHKMRTALRRLRSILQVYGRVVDRDQTRQLTEELKWLAGVFAPARDLEVLRQRLDETVAALPAELVLGPVKARLTRQFARQEQAARSKFCAVLDGRRYAQLLERLERLVEHPPLTERASRPARSALLRELRRTYKRFDRRMRWVHRAPAGPDSDTALHETRKAAKRLRYGIDAARPVLGGPADRFTQRLTKVQQLLGDHHDAVVARPQLRELSLQAHLDGENGFTYGLLHGAQSRVTDEAERKLPRALDKLTKPKNRRWLS